MRFLLLLLFLAIPIWAGETLSLPKEFIHKRIFYMKAPLLPNFCCGYNVIYNACCIEDRMGKPNAFSNNQKYRKQVGAFLTARNKKPTEGSPSDILFELARFVNLQNFHYMMLDINKKVFPILSKGIDVVIPYNSTREQKKRLIEAAQEKERKSIMMRLKSRFDAAPKGKSYFLHFACHCVVEGEEHGILITVAKDKNGRKSLYIYDNMNETITTKSDITPYIRYFSNLFAL